MHFNIVFMCFFICSFLLRLHLIYEFQKKVTSLPSASVLMLASFIKAVRSYFAELIINKLTLITINYLLSMSLFTVDVDANIELSELPS